MAATATARRATARAQTAPARRPVRPARAPRPQRAPGPVARTAVVVGGLADSGMVFGLTRSRRWIVLVGGLLIGIVALNVMALSFNASSSKTAGISDELRRENSALRAQIADGLSNGHLQKAALRIGLIMPEAAATLLLVPQPGDAAEAAKRLRNGDITLGSIYEPPVVEPVTPVVDPAVDPAATVVDPAAPVTPTDTAVSTETAPTTVDPATGGVMP